MPRLDVLDEEFGDAAAHARRRRIGERLLMLAIVALGLGAIGALAFAWSNADGPLRFELQSAATAPKSAQRAAAQEEIERLQGELDALKNDVKELTEAQHQAAHTIATMKAAEEDLRRDVPPPYWYSNPATLDLAIANQPQWAGGSAVTTFFGHFAFFGQPPKCDVAHTSLAQLRVTLMVGNDKHARKPSSHDQQSPQHGVWPTCGPNCAAYIAHNFPGTLGLCCRTLRLRPHMNSAKP